MNARIIKLNALAYAIRARAKNHDFASTRWRHLGLLLIGAVVVRRFSRKLSSTGVDSLVNRPQPKAVSHLAHLSLSDSTQLRNLNVAETVFLGQLYLIGIERFGLSDVFGDLVNQDDLVDEPRIDFGGLKDLLTCGASSKRLLN